MPDIGRWGSLDNLSEKFFNLSPYNYTANNPVFYIDPDGNDIRIWYKDENGKNVSFVFNGDNLHDAPKNDFVTSFIDAWFFNVSNGGGDNMKDAAFDREREYNLIETNDGNSRSTSDQGVPSIIVWDPIGGLEVENGDILSPATTLEHEFDHAVDRRKDKEKHQERRGKQSDKNYSNDEEIRVIKGSETKQAKLNGEIDKNKTQSRYCHGCGTNKKVKTKGPTSNEKIGYYEY